MESVARLDEEIKRLEAAATEAPAEGKEAANAAVGETKKRREAAARAQPFEVAYGVVEGSPANARIQLRGEPTRLGAEVPRGFLSCLGGTTLPANAPGSGRRQLAAWLTQPDNPLTARVMVNRIWQHHFGRGLVVTANDFGLRGRAPTHPELLDYLAARFVAGGWSVKALHKQIMLSHCYQTASAGGEAASRLDPDNLLLNHFPRQRLDAESLRDAMLATSGELDRTPAGPHPFPPVESWGFTQHNPFKAVYDHRHRSVFLMTQRLQRHPLLLLFDGADPNASTAERAYTTTPLQALYLMNDPFVDAQATALARRLFAAQPAASDEPGRLTLAYEMAWGRPPHGDEVDGTREFLASYQQDLAQRGVADDQRPLQAWAALCRVLLTSNEFLFID